jgi:hypothetical protein
MPRSDAVRTAWEVGRLRYKLKPEQQQIYDAFRSYAGRKMVLHCSRRFGKSFLLALFGVEEAIRRPGSQISIVCPTQKNMRIVLQTVFQPLLADCPADLRPSWSTQNLKYDLPNGSSIYLFGADAGNIENLRGQSAALVIIDEAGFIDDLEYAVDSILMPQLLTTGGKLLLSSSSPLTPDHAFVRYMVEADQAGAYFKFTIDQAGYPPELITEFAKEAGGRDTTTFRREYMCELVVDSDRALCPEWKTEYEIEVERDKDFFGYYSKYAVVDSGVRDRTVGGFAYFDFKHARLVVEDEFSLVGSDVRTDVIANLIRAKEAALDYSDVSRYADNNNLILIQDLSAFHNVGIIATSKDSLEAMVNQVRLWVSMGKIVVHPRCKLLTQTLRHGTWNKTKTDFDRTKALGHMDAFAMLMYMVRNVQDAYNPIPQHWNVNPSTHFIDTTKPQYEGPREQWRGLLGLKGEEDNDE